MLSLSLLFLFFGVVLVYSTLCVAVIQIVQRILRFPSCLGLGRLCLCVRNWSSARIITHLTARYTSLHKARLSAYVATNYSYHKTTSMDRICQILVPSNTYLEAQGLSVMSFFPLWPNYNVSRADDPKPIFIGSQNVPCFSLTRDTSHAKKKPYWISASRSKESPAGLMQSCFSGR